MCSKTLLTFEVYVVARLCVCVLVCLFLKSVIEEAFIDKVNISYSDTEW